MKEPKKRNIPVIVAIVVTALVLVGLAVGIILVQNGGQEDTTPSTTAPVLDYDLYWNLDRAQYMGQSENGSSSRKKGSDGYYHISFFIDGKTVDLKVAEKQVVNDIDVNDLVGLTFDENGIVVGMTTVWDMPCQVTAWNYYIQSVESNRIMVNSSPLYNGDEQMLLLPEGLDVYDMTGAEGEIGMVISPIKGDRLIAISNAESTLTHIFVNERKEFMHASEGYCEHCKENVKWVEYDKTNKLPFSESGHYKLMNDIKLNGQQGVSANVKVCLDLNGFTVEGKAEQRVIAMSAENAALAIMDSSEAKTGRIVAHHQNEDTKQGILLFLHKSDVYLYSGILDASDAITNGTGGAAVYVAADRTFTMNGGEIIGGTAVPAYQEKNGSYRYGNGGSVGVMGKFIMNDGVIRDGVAKSATVWKNGKANYQRGMGGNVYVGTTGVFEMNGGTIKDGKAGTAGNVFLDGAGEFIMNGGTIANGRAVDPGRNAGNINFLTKAKFTMNGGEIIGGTSTGTNGSIYTRGTFTMNGGSIYGGAVYDKETGKRKENNTADNILAQNGANVTITGGRIYGGVLVQDTDEKDKMTTYLTLSGSATIWSGEENATNLSLPVSKEPVQVKIRSMYSSAKVGVNASGIFSLETDEKNTDKFVSDVPEAEVVYYNKCLAVGKLACLCGSKTETHLGECDGTALLWAPWNTANNLPSADGNYYLVTDVAFASGKNFGARDKQVNINLDLNGKTVQSEQRAFVAYGNVNIADHAGGGQVIGSGLPNNKDHGAVVIAFANSRLGIYGGTFKLADKHYNITNAGVMTVAANAEVNVYGGVIDGRSANQTVEGEGVSTVEHGGAVRLSGTMNLLGGEVYGGDVTGRGGAIYLQDKTAVLNIDGGTIHGGTAKQGGSIYVNNGSVNMTKGLISGGSNTGTASGDHGGSIYIAPNGAMTMTGGTVEKGVSPNRNGGNIACRGKLTVGGEAKVLDGTAKAVNSHNIYVQDGQLTLAGNALINGGVSVVSSTETGAKISLSGAVTVENKETGGYLNLGRTGKNPVPVIQITGALTDGEKKANIAVKLGSTTSGVFAQGADYTLTAADEACFTAQDSGLKVKLEKDNSLILTDEGTAETETRCLCKTGDKPWCDHTQETWVAWNGQAKLENGKNYYLTKDITNGKKIGLTDVSVKLDLNGHTYASAERAIQLRNAVLHIVDSSYDTGMMTGMGVSGKVDTGAVFHVVSSTVNIYSGTYALAEGHNQVGNGGVMIVGGTGAVNIYGGTIGSESSANPVAAGGAIYFNSSAELNIYGGTVKANGSTTGNGTGIYMNNGTFTVGGDAVIENIYLPTGKVITVDESFDTAKASVTVDVQTVGVFAQGVDGFTLTDAVKDRFVPVNTEYTLTLDTAQNALVLSSQVAPQPVVRCLCKTGDKAWCDHTQETWLPWDGSGTLQDGSNYYLTGPVQTGKTQAVSGINVKLDLNGHTYAATQRAFELKNGAVMHIVDSSYATGVMTGGARQDKVDNGGVFHVLNSTLNLYSGTYALGENSNEIGNGGVMVVGGTSTVNIYGGTIGTETSVKPIANGGAINFGGKALNIYGGTVKANNSVTGTGKGINVTAGTVTVGGNAVIENIYLPTGKTLVVADGFDADNASITVQMQTPGVFTADTSVGLSNEASKGFHSGNKDYVVVYDGVSYLLEEAQFVASNCLCGKEPHEAWCTQTVPQVWSGTGLPTQTGNYKLTASVEVAEPVVIADGVHIKLWLEGNNITPAESATLTNIFTVEAGGSLALMDSTQTKGAVSAKAGMTRVITSDGDLSIDGAGINASAITAGTENGVGICVDAGTFTLIDGQITGGKTTTKNGGAVFVSAGATMTMEGGKISGGQGKQGGNLAVQGDAQITGGEISGGLAEIGGNILVNNGGHLEASGGSILNGRFTSRGGNIGIEENGTVTLSDNVVISGGVHNTNASTNPDRANVSLFSSNKSGSLTLSDVNLPDGKILVVNSGKNPVVYLSGTVKVGGGATGLKLGRTGSNKMATIQIAADGLAADSAIDLSANNTGSAHVLVTGLTAAQKTAVLANNNFVIRNDGFKLSEKANGEKFDLVLTAK